MGCNWIGGGKAQPPIGPLPKGGFTVKLNMALSVCWERRLWGGGPAELVGDVMGLWVVEGVSAGEHILEVGDFGDVPKGEVLAEI